MGFVDKQRAVFPLPLSGNQESAQRLELLRLITRLLRECELVTHEI